MEVRMFLVCAILFFCSITYAQNQSESDLIFQIVRERTKDVKELFATATRSKGGFDKSIRESLTPCKNSWWKIYNELKVSDGVPGFITVQKYSDKIVYLDTFKVSYSGELKIDSVTKITKDFKPSAIPEATIFNGNKNQIRNIFSQGFLVSTYLNRSLVFAGGEHKLPTHRNDEYINIVWFFKPAKKKGNYIFDDLEKEDFKLVGYGVVPKPDYIEADYRDSWDSETENNAKAQAQTLVKQYLDDLEKDQNLSSDAQQRIMDKYFTKNAAIAYLSISDHAAIKSSGGVRSYLASRAGKEFVELQTSLQETVNIIEDSNRYAVVKTIENFTLVDSTCTCGKNIVVTFDNNNGELGDFKINGIVFAAPRGKRKYSCDKIRMPPPPPSLALSEYQLAKKKFNKEAPILLEDFLTAVKDKLEGRESDDGQIRELFINSGKNSKIRVTSHRTNRFKTYKVSGYISHLEELRKKYKAIDFSFNIRKTEIQPGTLGNKKNDRGIWTGKIQFTQTFRGYGDQPYADQTVKTVNLIIFQDDTSFKIMFGDIWFETTERL
jgi:hypothetical protein